ncbi:MAG: NAD(P)/FAD-dependent oxidoreductase, partial [Nocardioidaceae bacterium]
MSVTNCDVVVVGGGITGAATAAHLAAAGITSVTVLDAGPPGSGTTPAGNGTIGIWSAGFFAEPRTSAGLGVGRVQAEMQRYAIDYYAELGDATDIGFRNNGTLWVSRFPTSLQEQFDRMLDHPLAPEAREVTPEDVRELWPTVREGQVAGGVYHPTGAQIDAGRATRALVDLGRRSGVEYQWAARVAQVLHDGNRTTGVMLTSGDVIRAGTIVVCVGAWTNALLEPLGRRLPLLPWLTSRVTVPDMDAPAVLPTILLPDLGGLWLREDAGGYT